MPMRVIQVAKKGGPFKLVERELPHPRPGEVRIKVQACGVCHSDSIAKEGLFPTVPYTIVDKEKLARQLGAHVCLDSQSQDVPAELMTTGL